MPMCNSALYDFAMSVAVNGQFESIVWESGLTNMRKRNNPYVGRVRKIVKGSGLQFGVSYANKVNNERERNGLSRDFVPQTPPYGFWKEGEYPRILRNKRDESVMYLRVSPTKHAYYEVIYLIDNRVATPAEMAELLEFIPKSDHCDVFDIRLDHIIKWRVGGEVYEDAEKLQSIANAIAIAR